MSTQYNKLLDSTCDISNREIIKNRFENQGYLFFKGVLDFRAINDLRHKICDILYENGWLKKNSNPVLGHVDLRKRCTEGEKKYVDVYHKIYKLKALHESGHWKDLLNILNVLFDKGVFPIPQKILRMWFPKFLDHTTPFHQDYVHFQSKKQITTWIPLGDCDIELGGLGILPNSHKKRLKHEFSLGAGNLKINSEIKSNSVYTTNYKCGDLLIFDVNLIHGALPNYTDQKIRLSLDNRFQEIGHPVAEHLLEPHLFDQSKIGWDEIYKNWEDSDDNLKYYWKKYDHQVLKRDEQYIELAVDDAINKAYSNQKDALNFLKRLQKLNPESKNGKKASEALLAINN